MTILGMIFGFAGVWLNSTFVSMYRGRGHFGNATATPFGVAVAFARYRVN